MESELEAPSVVRGKRSVVLAASKNLELPSLADILEAMAVPERWREPGA